MASRPLDPSRLSVPQVALRALLHHAPFRLGGVLHRVPIAEEELASLREALARGSTFLLRLERADLFVERGDLGVEASEQLRLVALILGLHSAAGRRATRARRQRARA
jgi:hypothetical protein